jgi:hypothetical protein
VPDSEAAEATVHRLLSDKRPSPNREFFICTVADGKAAIAATVAGAKPKGEPPPFAGPLPVGWKPPVIPAVRLPSNRAGQIQSEAAKPITGDDMEAFALSGWTPAPIRRPTLPAWVPPVRRRRRRGWMDVAACLAVAALWVVYSHAGL